MLLRVVSAGVLATVAYYGAFSGQELPGFWFVVLIGLVGVAGIWQLTATPQELEQEQENTPLRDLLLRDAMIRWYVFAFFAVGFAIREIISHGSGQGALLGLIAGTACLLLGAAHTVWLERRRRIRSTEQ